MKRVAIAVLLVAVAGAWGAALAQAPAPRLELTEEQKKAEEAFSLADGLYRKGFYDKALGKLLEFVATYAQHPNAPLALLNAGECQYAEQKYAEAAPLYQRVLTEYANSDEAEAAAYRLGQSKLSAGDGAGAIAAFSDLRLTKPNSQYLAAALYWTGEAHFQAGKHDQAMPAYDESRRLAPQGQYAAYAVYSIGVCQQRLGKPQEAAASFRAVVKDYSDSAVAAESEVRLAEALYAAGQTTEAEAAFDAVLKRGQAELLPQALSGLGWCRFEAQKWPEARASFERLVKDHPGDALAGPARRRIADCLYREDKLAEAAQAYEAAMPSAAKEEVPDILFWQAAAYEKAGDKASATRSYQRLVTEYPTSPQAAKASLRLADTLAEAKDLAGAEKAYRTAAGSADAELKVQGELGLAWVAYQRGDAVGALKEYERIGRAAPASAPGAVAVLQGAKIALAGKDYAKCAELAGLFIQSNANHDDAPEAHYVLGLSRAATDDRAGAVGEFDVAVQAAPKADFAADALRRMAQLYRQLGDNAKADAAVARLRKDFPESGAGAEAQYEAASELLRAGKAAEAAEAYQATLAGATDPAIAALCQFGLASAYFEQGKYDQALAAYRIVTDKHQQSEAATPAALQVGVCLARVEKYAEAAAALEKFIDDNATSEFAPQATGELAWAHYKSGQQDKAKALYEKLAVMPGVPAERAAEALFRLGEIAYEAADYEGALARYTELATKYPASDLLDDAQYKRGWSLLHLKRADEAVEAFRQCLAAKPPTEIAGDCHYRIAVALIAKGQTDPAIQELVGFRTEYRSSPAAPFALLNLAELYALKGDYAGAESTAAAAPDSGEAAFRARRALVLGQALRGAKKLEEAKKQLSLAAELGEGATAAAARFELAAAEAELGNHSAAADGFLNVAIVYGESPLAPRAMYEAGLCFERAKAPEDAKKAYNGLLKDYPQAAEWVEKAKARLQGLGG